jgi:folate-dependent phosphoribosylglycinamide formyltransferase PurN
LTSPLLLLGGDGASTRIVYHRLAQTFGAFPAVVEQPVARSVLIRNRLRRLGIASTLSQLAFMTLIRPLLSRAARGRLEEIARQHRLDETPIPADLLTSVASVNSDETIAAIKAAAPKVIVVNGTRIIARRVLEASSATFLNTHAGITPRYRGAHGGYWALLGNDREHCGVTIHVVDPGIDTGAIVAQALIDPTKQDSFVTYPYLQLAAALPLLVDSVGKALRGELAVRPAEGQSGVWYHPGLFQYLIGRARGVK